MNEITASSMPWKYLPPGYTINEQGVFLHRVGEKKQEDQQLTTVPAWVESISRELGGGNWAVEIAWRDQDGNLRSHFIGYASLVSGSEYVADLASNGLLIVPRSVPAFSQFLSMYVSQANVPRFYSFPHLGLHAWQRGKVSDVLHFVTSSGCLAPNMDRLREVLGVELHQDLKGNSASVRYKPRNVNKAAAGYHSRGTLEEWRAMVAPFAGNDLLVFAPSLAFASLLVGVAEVDIVIAHLYGNSSSGKTTALQVAMSVLGQAGDPQVPSGSNVERWNTTANGVELLLSEHSGMLAAVDELGSSADAVVSVYNATAGSGKIRMTDTGQRREQLTWALCILSSGEVPMREKIESASKRPAKTGELIRALDIPVGSLATGQVDFPEEQGAVIANLKRQCGEVYGTAGPAFAQGILDHFVTAARLREHLRQMVDGLHVELVAHAKNIRGLEAAHVRALRRFAFIQAAGVLAVQTDVLPFNEEAIRRSIYGVAEAWLEALPSLSEGEQAVESIRGYVIKNCGQMLHYESWVHQGAQKERMPYQMAAIWKKDMIYFTKQQFQEACGNVPAGIAIKYMKSKGMMHCEVGKSYFRMSSIYLDYTAVPFYVINVNQFLSNEEIRGIGNFVERDDDSSSSEEAGRSNQEASATDGLRMIDPNDPRDFPLIAELGIQDLLKSN